MSAADLALPRIKREEGFRGSAYHDTQGHQTIGYGFNVDAGISEHAAESLLIAQLDELHIQLLDYPWYRGLDDMRQSVLIDIAFNAGIAGLEKFPNMLAAIQRQDWPMAQAECHVENPELASRYAALGQILLSGTT